MQQRTRFIVIAITALVIVVGGGLIIYSSRQAGTSVGSITTQLRGDINSAGFTSARRGQTLYGGTTVSVAATQQQAMVSFTIKFPKAFFGMPTVAPHVSTTCNVDNTGSTEFTAFCYFGLAGGTTTVPLNDYANFSVPVRSDIARGTTQLNASNCITVNGSESCKPWSVALE